MCEVQGPGGAPGRSAGAGGASTPPGRLSVSSSESDEDQKAPRNSLLGSSEDSPSNEPAEGTANSRDDSNMEEEEEDDEEEEESSSEVVVVTLNIVEKKDKDDEEEEEKEKKIDDETEMEEKDTHEMKVKERKGSENEAKEVQGCDCDETEIENLENERRDELLENTLKRESEIEEEKMAHDMVEENSRRNDEGASAADSLKEVEPQKQKEDEEEDEEKKEEEERKDDKEQRQEEVIVKEEEEMEMTSKHSHEDQKKTKEKEEEMKEITKEEEKEQKETKKEAKENEKQEDEKEAEGVDPFSPKCAKEDLPPPTTTKVSKTVNFLESELKAISERKRHTINSYTSSSSSSKSKEAGEAKDEDVLERLEVDEKTSKHWTLGEGNPVYRLSLKLSPNLFNVTDIPGANQHKEADKAGFLTKLSGRSFPYIAQWKRRYCVLSKGRLYYYEKEDSKAGDKSNGVIQLEYFDQVAEAGPKECKKATNVFIITSQDRSFFDPGRHVFSADTLPDMKDWIRKLQAALDQIRNNNRPAASTSPSASPSAKERGGKRKDEAAEGKEGKGSQTQTATATSKERRKKKEDSSRPRKSSKTGVSSQTQTSMGEPPASDAPDGGRPVMAIPRGGVMLPGFSSRKDPQPTNRAPERRSGDGEAEDDLPQAGPTLTCVTKQRVKGPQGRRAPQNRRKAAAALKKRASSLSALEHQDASDNREAPWLNRSLDVLEGGNPWGGKQVGSAVPSSALPYKAYNYSTDEDDIDDDQSDSFPASASGMPPPPPPPRSASYGLELMRSASQGRVAPRGRKAPRCSLDEARGSQADLGDSRDSLGGWRGSHGEAWGQNGRASPVMDDLDNLLMNQSVQHSSAALDSISDAGSEGSSTCRAADHQQPAAAPDHCHHHHHHHHQMQQGQQPRKKPQDLGRFTTAVRHLQRHVVEIDRAVFAVTGDVASTRREVATLREAVAALQADAHTITTTLSNLTQEAITAQQKIAYATQSDADILPPEKEAEKVQLTVREALLEAERAKQEQMRSKREYEDLVAEMKVALQFFKEASPVSVQVPAQDPASSTAPASVAKSSSNSQGGKGSTGYQSLFSKSSSIISGFTSRHSLTKSVSFAAEQKEKRKSNGPENKANSLERDKKYDKKDKKDGKSQASVQTSKDKKDKHSDAMDKKDSIQQHHKQKPLPEAGLGHLHRLENGEGDTKKTFTSLERRERRLRDKRAHVISPLSLEDIPMADDVTHEHAAKSDPTTPSVEPDASEAQSQKASFKQTLSITLGQSSTAASGASNRPQVLALSRDRHSGDLSTSNTSPESPLPPTSSTRPGSFLPTLEESPPVSGAASLSSLHQPGSTPGPQARQGAMSTVHKDRPLSTSQQTKRIGTFAISRQHSSPNIPLQRQNSGSAFPIQRQQSLGTVPEGRLPRQESLTSVPEERPVVDRTLPLSPSPSLTYFPLSSTHSSSTLSDSARRAARESMELVTGPVLAGSSIQEANATGTLPVLHLDEQNMQPAATSTLKRASQSHSDNVGILV
ncbi:uncharacterized protein LOC135099608 isoform X1 [Scylla paramamosain]|uniref:uncharacterized protein LOC135099608 isoform X1 n=1 Tax=Scylla paramamosain TaxID=85552 RepID=UPI003083D3A3